MHVLPPDDDYDDKYDDYNDGDGDNDDEDDDVLYVWHHLEARTLGTKTMIFSHRHHSSYWVCLLCGKFIH